MNCLCGQEVDETCYQQWTSYYKFFCSNDCMKHFFKFNTVLFQLRYNYDSIITRMFLKKIIY